MNKTVSNTDQTTVAQAADPAITRHPAAPDAATPGYGAFAPGALSQIGLKIGRALPASRLGLRLAGLARPLALHGVKAGTADVEALGLKLRLHPRDNLSEKRLFMTPQCLDRVELGALRAAMGPGKVFMDIGANAGVYSLVAALAGGEKARIIAVEPQREMRRRLGFNARQNGLGNIEIAGVALSDYEGEEVMRMINGNHGQARLGGVEGEAVRVTTLLTLMEELRVSRAHLMKIDVEGGEAQILSHFFANAPRDRWPELLFLERVDLNQHDGADAATLALGRGYRLQAQTHQNVVLAL